MSFSFGTPKTATGFTLPTATTTPTTNIPGGSGDTKVQGAKPPPNLFGTPPTSTPGTGFLNLTPKITTATLTPSFSLTPASAAVSIPATTSITSTTSFTPILATGSSLTSGFSLASTAAASTTPLKLTSSLTPATSIAATSAPSLGLGGITTTSQVPAVSIPTTTASISTAGSLSYAQLEDSINKWTIDLEEQGKFFINQAKQLNAWDSLLLSNSDKILQLNDTIEIVKQEQKRLDQELDFILAQQNELDELSLPLEKQLTDMPISDQSRFQTYQLSEFIDSQLKQMSEDLKEIVEHLNESNKNEDISDPVIQISRILNAHMNSLQWIDRNTSQISTHLEQISQLHETCKKNHLNL